MTDHIWWCCRTCGEEMYDSPAVLRHREQTGHIGASILSKNVPSAGPGSSAAARRAAREAVAAAIRDAKVTGGRG